MSRAISRTAVFAPISASIVPPRCAWASPCKRCRTCSMTHSGSGKSPRSSVRRTSIRVVLEADPSWQADPFSLLQLRVPGSNGAQVPLSGIASIERTTAPLVITHQEQFPSVTLSFNLAPGYSLGNAVRAVAATEREIQMPQTISGTYSGDAAEFERSLAGGALADSRRRRGDLHRARRAVRELDPSGHDSLHASVGRDRSPAGADALRRGSLARGAGRHGAA